MARPVTSFLGLLVCFTTGIALAEKSLAADAGSCAADYKSKTQSGERAYVASIPDIWTVVLRDGRKIIPHGFYIPISMPGGDLPKSVIAETNASALENQRELFLNKSVFVKVLSKKADRHGRLQAVLLNSQKQDYTRAMIETGAVLFDGLAAKLPCVDHLQAAEEIARKAGAGLWSLETDEQRLMFTVKPDTLLAAGDLTVTLIGKIMSVGIREKRHYLNFGKNWSKDFTAEISPKVTDRVFGGAGFLNSLNGRWVKIRGKVKTKYGPMIEIKQLGQLEVLSR